jgi:hypothetical protein
LKTRILERLKHSVQLLAASPEIQLSLLPNYVCKADELALDFDLWLEITLHNSQTDLTTDQRSALTALNEKLGHLTAEGKQHWNDEAVRTSRAWQEVRNLAKLVLEAFGWPAETPPSHADEYVSEDSLRKPRPN